MSQGRRIVLIIVAVVAFGVMGVIQQPLNYLRYDPKAKGEGLLVAESLGSANKSKNVIYELPVQFLGAAAIGMREVVSGMLWVRADEFFHTGQYEAVLPIVRICTWLDPQQIDIYTTGAWHMDYNFVDSEERSDRRYIPPAVALMEEGVANNPSQYDLYFELAWTHYYQKARQYEKAIYWMEKANKLPALDPNTGKAMPRPMYVSRMLAHAYEKAGMLDAAEKQWDKCLADAKKAYNAKDGGSLGDIVVTQKNLGLMLLRRGWRYGDLAAFERGVNVLSEMKSGNPAEDKATAAAKAYLLKWKAVGKMPADTQPQVATNTQLNWKRVKPRVIRIYGSANLIPMSEYKSIGSESYTEAYKQEMAKPAPNRIKMRDGCRLRVMVCDYDYDYWNLPETKDASWDLDRTQTVLWDEAMIRDGKIDATIDMSKDPNIYPFAKDKYRIVVWFNPQEAPDYVQDRIGWKGEGLTDKLLNTTRNPGYRMILKEFIVSKRDII